MLTIDGSFGEGGGQILRSSLALALVTGTAVRIENIRAGRPRPGLLQQHLTAVEAAAAVSAAEVEGARLRSRTLTFKPGKVRPGEYAFSVGTAGSATLVLQTVLPALVIASGPSALTLEGGTHNPHAPPFDFLTRAFLPLISRMGPRVEAALERPGFYPAGGGRFRATIQPAAQLKRLDLAERGELRTHGAKAMVARLPRHIAERELAVVEAQLGWERSSLEIEEVSNSLGPGNALVLWAESEHLTEVFTAFGERGVRAEAVADQAVVAVRDYLAADVPVGKHLADQLVLPLALAGGGSFRTLRPSRHTLTNIEVVRRFLPVSIGVAELPDGSWQVSVGA